MEGGLPGGMRPERNPARHPIRWPGLLDTLDGLSRPKSGRSDPSRDIASQCSAGQWMRCLKAFGERIAARDPDRQTAEIHIRIALMNRFSALGTAEIERVA